MNKQDLEQLEDKIRNNVDGLITSQQENIPVHETVSLESYSGIQHNTHPVSNHDVLIHKPSLEPMSPGQIPTVDHLADKQALRGDSPISRDQQLSRSSTVEANEECEQIYNNSVRSGNQRSSTVGTPVKQSSSQQTTPLKKASEKSLLCDVEGRSRSNISNNVGDESNQSLRGESPVVNLTNQMSQHSVEQDPVKDSGSRHSSRPSSVKDIGYISLQSIRATSQHNSINSPQLTENSPLSVRNSPHSPCSPDVIRDVKTSSPHSVQVDLPTNNNGSSIPTTPDQVISQHRQRSPQQQLQQLQQQQQPQQEQENQLNQQPLTEDIPGKEIEDLNDSMFSGFSEDGSEFNLPSGGGVTPREKIIPLHLNNSFGGGGGDGLPDGEVMCYLLDKLSARVQDEESEEILVLSLDYDVRVVEAIIR